MARNVGGEVLQEIHVPEEELPLSPSKEEADSPSNAPLRRFKKVGYTFVGSIAVIVAVALGARRFIGTKLTRFDWKRADLTALYAEMKAKSIYLCDFDPATPHAYHKCCEGIDLHASGVHYVQNRFGDRPVCGILNCSSGILDVKMEGEVCQNSTGTFFGPTQGGAVVPTFNGIMEGPYKDLRKKGLYEEWRKTQGLHAKFYDQKQSPMDLHALASRTYHQCPGNPAIGFKDCCANIGKGPGFFMVQSIYAGQAKCGYMSCPTGDFVGAACKTEMIRRENITAAHHDNT
jgi:hypothetical protein